MKILKHFCKKHKKDTVSESDTLLYIVQMLKEYGVTDIVASPGAQNANFNYIVQEDDYFKCYSVVDERSAGYVATGISNQSQKPVVITCTEATSSRNYLSALTEAFYRDIPLIAITFYNSLNSNYSLGPQHIDRSISQNDIKAVSVNLPVIINKETKRQCLVLLNAALSTAVYKHKPVHINCPSCFDIKSEYNYTNIKTWKTEFIFDDFVKLTEELKNKKIAIFIGSHPKFNDRTLTAIETFATSWGAAVFYDHTSSYEGCKNAILISQAANQIHDLEYADIIIDIGGICGDYSCGKLFNKADVWRITQYGEFKCRFSNAVKKHIVCQENTFFEQARNINNYKFINYFDILNEKIQSIQISDNLPLSNILVSKYLAKYIPNKSTLNVSILNSLRSLNFYTINSDVEIVCNVGGFGIDGQVSTLVGQAISQKDKLHFGLFGDLAFFYDMNILGNRHISNNIRILLINNNKGEEFRLIPDFENNLHDLTDNLIAAGGHNLRGAEAWAKSCGFEYMYTDSVENLESQIKMFCTKKYDKPVLFEIKTNDIDERRALEIMITTKR